MNKIKNVLFWLTHTKLGWFLISFAWGATFQIIDSFQESSWAFWVSLLGWAYVVGLMLVLIAYAWVINPIRERKESKKMKEEYEKTH